MNTMTKSTELYNQAIDSSGTMTEVQSKYMDTFNGKLGTLKSTFESLASNSLDSGFMKGGIEALTGFVNVLDSSVNSFGILPTVITGVVGAMTIFNTKFRENASVLTSSISPLNNFKNGLVGLGNKFKTMGATYSSQITLMKTFENSTRTSGAVVDGFGIQLLGLKAKLLATQVGMVACKVALIALQTAMSMALTMGVTALISGLGKLVDKIILTKDELNQLNSEFVSNNANSQNSKVIDLVNTYEKLQKTLSTLTEGTSEYKGVEEQLVSTQESILSIYPNASKAIDENTEAKRLNLEATKKLIEKDLELSKAGALDVLEKNDLKSNDNLEKVINDYNEYYKVLEQVNTLAEEGVNKSVNIDSVISDSGQLLVNAKDVDVYKKRVESLNDTLEASYEAYKILGVSNEKYAKMAMTVGEALGYTSEQTEALIDNLRETDDSINETVSSLQDINGDGIVDATDEMLSLAMATDSAKTAVENLASSFGAFQNSIELLKTMKEEFSEFGMLDTSTMEKVLSSGDNQLIALLGDEANFIENINQLLDEKTTAQDQVLKTAITMAQAEVNGSQEAIDATNAEIDAMNNLEQAKTSMAQNSANQRSDIEGQVVNNNARHYALDEIKHAEKEGYKIKGAFSSASQRMNAEKQVVDNNGKNYSVDSSNQANSENSKIKNADGFANASIQGVASMVTNNDKNYRLDSSNFASATNSKLANIRALNDAVGASAGLLNEYKQLTAETEEASKVQQSILYGNNGANLKKPNVGTVSSGYVGSGGIGGNVSHGSIGGSNSSSGSGSSSSSSKEIADIEIKTQRYYDLENAIEKVNNALDINNILSKNATDDKKLDYIKEEIKLYNQKREALEKLQAEQKKELAELQKSLADNGFSFDGDGNVSNLNNRLKQLESWANSGDKENRQATVKNIQELLDAYESLRDTVASTNSDILDINNSIIDAQKDISSVIKDQYEEWKSYEEKKKEVLKTEIQKQKDIMNKEWGTEDYEDKLDSEQKTLDDLMSQRQDALRTGDKELIASLDKQIAEQQKAISDLIRDQERDNANDKFDEVMDNLDKELEAKLEAMDKEMLDDVLLGKIQGGATSLSDIFSNINMASTDLNKNMLMVGDSIGSWSDGLSNFIADLSSLSSTQIPLSINGSIQGAIGSLSANSPISISTVINLEGGTVISESEFETAIENNNKYIFKEINNIFKR